MRERREILLEGYSAEEVLALKDDELRAFVFADEPLVFRAGSAEILGQFRLEQNRLVVELAQVDGGGEGVLPLLWGLAERYCRSRGLGSMEWVVHAVTCAKPNLKLRRVLERRGFVVRDLPGHGPTYHLIQEIRR